MHDPLDPVYDPLAAGLWIRELTTVNEQHAAAVLLSRVWRTSEKHQPIEPTLIRALAHAGNYVAGAYVGTELTGVSIGFFSAGGYLHSHITGVLPEHRGLNVGYTLKQHQRSWALDRGISEIHWTFDPLVGRNAYFNLHKLGAVPTAYLPDFYGTMYDGVNSGDASDRLYVVWRLDSPRVKAALAGESLLVADEALRDGIPLVVIEGGEPVAADVVTSAARTLLVTVPPDMEALRALDRETAFRWRRLVRKALRTALAAGYRISGISRDGRYVLEDVS